MTIKEMCVRAQVTAMEKGFSDGEPRFAEIERRLLLAVGELVEAQNDLRDGWPPLALYFTARDGEKVDATLDYVAEHLNVKPEGFGIELADAVIRIGQLAADEGIDLEACVETKMDFNAGRPAMHGGKRF
jgi:hypothetical protein